MSTTIQISKNVRSILEKQKISIKESINDVLERILEDTMEINEKTRKELIEAKKQIKSGESYSLEEIEKEFGLI